MRKRDISNSPCMSFTAGDEPERGSDRAPPRGSNAVAAAAATSRATFIQMIGLRSVLVISGPMISVPSTNAADAEPRIQPYSNGLPDISGFAALTDNASAIEVVGASAAACSEAIKSNSQKVFASDNAAAIAAAIAAQLASTRRHDLEISASLPTNGPAARRTNIAVPRMNPICCELKALVSKNFGQNGEATPNAAYMAA